MQPTIPNSSAFPQQGADGLTKREYFAAMAMQGFISNSFIGKFSPAEIVKLSVETADALIAQLNKATKNETASQ